MLERVREYKLKEVEEKKKRVPFKILEKGLFHAPPVSPFLKFLKEKAPTRIIAEVKKASPSRGMIVPHYKPRLLVREYEKGGAVGISCLIEGKFFGGKREDLLEIKKEVSLPLLVKEFILEEYQILEARVFGGDCILLISSLLSAPELEKLARFSQGLGMDYLLEIHTREDWEKIEKTSLSLEWVGINNRNLHTMEVEIETTLRLRKIVPPHIFVVSESGIKRREDISKLEKAGVDAFLVGESILRSENPRKKIEELRGCSE